MKAREMVEKLDSDYVLYKGGTPIDLESIIKIYGAKIAKEQREICAESIKIKTGTHKTTNLGLNAQILNAPAPEF